MSSGATAAVRETNTLNMIQSYFSHIVNGVCTCFYGDSGVLHSFLQSLFLCLLVTVVSSK